MRGYGGEDAALAAMKEGAYDYLAKPFRPDEVVLTLRKAEERERLRHTIATLRAQLDTTPVARALDRKSTRLNSSHLVISYAVFCLKKKKNAVNQYPPSIRPGSSHA